MNTDNIPTPETDALKDLLFSKCSSSEASYYEMRMLARRLEIQRSKLRNQVAELKKEVDDLHAKLRHAEVENNHNWQAMEFSEKERALADRLVDSLNAIDDRLTAVGDTVHGALVEKIAATRSIVTAALSEWKEVRDE